jgi:hypothetical protein
MSWAWKQGAFGEALACGYWSAGKAELEALEGGGDQPWGQWDKRLQ